MGNVSRNVQLVSLEIHPETVFATKDMKYTIVNVLRSVQLILQETLPNGISTAYTYDLDLNINKVIKLFFESI